MTSALVLSGWVAAVLAALWARRLARRLRSVGDAAHELRGAGAALALASAAMRREQGGLRRARAFESELDRMRAGLEDLDAARTGSRAPVRRSLLPLERALRTAAAGWRPVAGGQGRRVSLCWEAGTAAVRADRRRLAQVLGNLLANAMEHGSGAIRLRGRRQGSKVVVEVLDDGPRAVPVEAHPDRGRGLGIAARAAEEAGGRVTVTRTAEGTRAAVELPVADP
ncbi:MAG TPA: ATP-binding protein [Thermoleophilaceae bacterium]|nr:ATP-binding protein [Thermoleophilaceae bacterium]